MIRICQQPDYYRHSFCDPASVRSDCIALAYGIPSPFADFWIQTDDGGQTTALIMKMQNHFTVSSLPGNDQSELREFLDYIAADDAEFFGCGTDGLFADAQCGEVLLVPDGLEAALPPDAKAEIMPDPRRVYALLAALPLHAESLGPPDEWVADYLYRQRRNLCRAVLITLNGVDAALAVSTAENHSAAVLGGIMTLPEYRRLGLAAAAVSLLSENLRREGKLRQMVSRLPGNNRAFYLNLGFVPSDRYFLKK